MSEMRSKVNDILSKPEPQLPGKSSKREITFGIVNDIKNKINELKSKRKSENHTSELEIEVNKDLLNQFKKSKTIEGQSSSLPNTTDQQSLPKQNKIDKDKDRSPLHKNEPQKLINNNHNNLFSRFNLDISNHSDTQSVEKVSYDNRKVLINEPNSRPVKTFLGGNDSNSINSNGKQRSRENSEDRKVSFEGKRDDLMGELSYQKKGVGCSLKKSLSIGRGNTNVNASNAPKEKDRKERIGSINIQSQNRIKEKIQHFVFQLDELGNKDETANTKHSHKYSFSPIPQKNEYDAIPSPRRFESQLNQKISSIINKPFSSASNVSITGNRGSNANSSKYSFQQSTKNADDDFFFSSKATAINKMPLLQISDIKTLSNKLRFSSAEDLRKMDDGIVDELINLASLINKLFENRKKAKLYNLC